MAGHGRHVLVEDSSGQRTLCHPRGKKSQAVVGDRVRWMASQDAGTIEHIEPRRNLFFRQDQVRVKSFAANLDQILILQAAQPEFSNRQLSRALIAAHAQGIRPLVALNKSDLAEPFEQAWERLLPYRQMGYAVLGLSLATPNHLQTERLRELLQGHTTLVLGPSGAGKSTLINTMVPNASVQTGDLSKSLNRGRHTTSHTAWYWADSARSTALIDSPGFQEFGLFQIDAQHLVRFMPDLGAHADKCRFYNCTHLHEPGCAVLEAVKDDRQPGSICPTRHAIYAQLFAELSQAADY